MCSDLGLELSFKTKDITFYRNTIGYKTTHYFYFIELKDEKKLLLKN